MSELRFQISDLLGHPGAHRDVYGEAKFLMRVGQSEIRSSSATNARLTAVSEGILVEAWTGVMAYQACVRCLTEWEAPIETTWAELFTRHPETDESPITGDGWIDLEPLVRDELSLALPKAPLCRPDCAGLCAECGADLNTAPCEGHGDQLDGPFAALKQLFGSET